MQNRSGSTAVFLSTKSLPLYFAPPDYNLRRLDFESHQWN